MTSDTSKYERIAVTFDEMVALVGMARREQVLTCTYGSGHIIATPGNEWAVKALREMRSAEMPDG